MNFILMKDFMVISDMLYILQHFNLNFIPFFIVNTVVKISSVKISSVNHIYLESSNTLLRNLDTMYKVVSWIYEYKSFNNINSITSPFLSI